MVPDPPNTRALEESLVKDFKVNLSYGQYLRLDEVLGAQRPVSVPVHHDELLFIIQHQTSELWLKLVLHELRAARQFLAADRVAPALKSLARVKHIQRSLTEQWSVLATLTPTEYAEFRSFLGTSSGFQSYQYRAVEFILGNKNAKMLAFFEHDDDAHALLAGLLEEPSVYDEFLRYLARQGYEVPSDVLDRDVTRAYVYDQRLVPMFLGIYQDPHGNWSAYETCEELVDLEENFQFWRFRHLKTVERIIGNKVGTGGSSGTSFLKAALDLTFFPELYAVRGEIGL
jgi:tryptophan 2,3-dioxygenase